MKVTVVTVCYNAQKTIRDTMESVKIQDYEDMEHIVVDGGSTDGTQSLVSEYPHVTKFVSETDRGIYDAMNKSIELASGDLIGFLHADDYFADSSCVRRLAELAQSSQAAAVLADVDMVSAKDPTRSIRFFSARGFNRKWIEQNDAPPYPGIYVRREAFEIVGDFDLQFPIAADFDFIVRLLYVNNLDYAVLPYTVVKMRYGGQSTKWPLGPLRNVRDVYRSSLKNGLPITPLSLAGRYLRRLKQFSDRATSVSSAPVQN